MTTDLAISPWRVLLPIGLGTSLSLIGDTSLYAVLPTHTVEAGVALTAVGILLSANRFIRLILNGPVGWVYDRSPRRYLFVTALFIGAGSTAIYALTLGFWPLLVGRLLWGLAWAGIWIGGNTIILDMSQPHDRGRWVGIYQAFFFMGASGGSMLGGFLTDWLGYHQAMGIGATLTFMGAVIAWLFLPETRDLQPAENTLKLPTMPEASLNSPATRRSELASAMGLLAVNRLVLAGVLLPTLGLFLLGQIGESTQVAGITIGVATLTGIALGATGFISMLATPVMGGLSDRVGNRWQVAAGGLIPGMAGFGLLAFGSPLTLLLAIPLTAVTGGSNQGISTALVGDLSGAGQRGQRLGILFTIGDLTSAIGPPLAYGIIPQLGLTGVYLLSAGVIGLMFLIALQWAVRLTLAGRSPAYGIDQ
jgi:MFS family permease